MRRAAAVARAIELAPGLAAAWFNLGAIQIAQGEAARGIESYPRRSHSIRVSPKPGATRGALGAEGDKPGEIEAYRRAVGINPRLAPVWGNLGGALLEAGEIGEAPARPAGRATELDPGLRRGLEQPGKRAARVRRTRGGGARRARRRSSLRRSWPKPGAPSALPPACPRTRSMRPSPAPTAGRGIRSPARRTHLFQSRRDAAAPAGHNAEAIGCPASRRLRLTRAMPRRTGIWVLLSSLRANFRKAGRRTSGAGAATMPRHDRYDFTPWDGDAPRHRRRLLLWAEQGIGDHILYGSLLDRFWFPPPLHITLEVDPRLASLYPAFVPADRR